jgi:L-asparaginase II
LCRSLDWPSRDESVDAAERTVVDAAGNGISLTPDVHSEVVVRSAVRRIGYEPIYI